MFITTKPNSPKKLGKISTVYSSRLDAKKSFFCSCKYISGVKMMHFMEAEGRAD